MKVALAGTSPTSANELYVRFGAVPSLGAYDFIYQNAIAPNQEIEIPTTHAGWYYIMVRGTSEPGGPLDYTLGASIIPFAISSVSPSNIGDNGQVTLTVKGAKFQPGASVQLIFGGQVYSAQTNFFDDPTSLRARFQLTNAVHGIYDVVLTNPGNQSTTAAQAISIETALPLTARVVGGDINLHPRVGLPFNWAGAVVNAGNVDIPYLTVSAALDQQLPITLNPPSEALMVEPELYDNSFGGSGFVVRNLAPGGSSSFSFRVSDFTNQDFACNVVPTAQSKQDFLANIVNSAEAIRDLLVSSTNALTYTATNSYGVITTNVVTVPSSVATALASPESWEQYIAQGLVDYNIIDAEDLNSLPVPQLTSLAGPSAHKTSACAVCISVLTAEKVGFTTYSTLKTANCIATILAGPEAPPACIVIGAITKTVTTVVTYETETICEDLNCIQPHYPPCRGCTPIRPPPWLVHPYPPLDPNEKEGPAGYSPAHFVGSQVPGQYNIYFENKSNALAFARQVTINDPLDPSLDIRNFRVGDIVIGNATITVPPNRAYYQTRIPLPPPNPSSVVADVTAGVDVQHHSLFWTMNAIDLNTGQLVAGTQEGILPPDTANNIGAGHVSFTIKPATTVPTGTPVTNQATTVFSTRTFL